MDSKDPAEASQDSAAGFQLQLMCINKAEIRALIPHSGLMCLLDEVTDWDDRSITCVTNTHCDPANPLRRGERLSAVHAFEYGAQAAAVHGGLRARSLGATAPPGYLAALRGARLHVARLDDIESALQVHALRLYGDGVNCVYECRVSARERLLAEGRVIIVERELSNDETRMTNDEIMTKSK